MTKMQKMKKRINEETRLHNALSAAFVEFVCDPMRGNPKALSLTVTALGDDFSTIDPRNVKLQGVDGYESETLALTIAEGDDVEELLNMGGIGFAEHCLEFIRAA